MFMYYRVPVMDHVSPSHSYRPIYIGNNCNAK